MSELYTVEQIEYALAHLNELDFEGAMENLGNTKSVRCKTCKHYRAHTTINAQGKRVHDWGYCETMPELEPQKYFGCNQWEGRQGD